MNQLRLTGDSTAGQCRLGPLVFCAQDSYQLYSYCVHLMCILHKNVSHDLLKTHSERFETIFRQLKHFYMQISNISYLGQFITIPTLPLHPPNFVF